MCQPYRLQPDTVIGLLGHTEQATPVGAPISTPAEPCTISSPLRVMSPCRAAGFPLILTPLYLYH
ncbi:hypothetical protein FT228_02110 [Escherichia coli]|nr:hypothetical protein [Escherichia coli]